MSRLDYTIFKNGAELTSYSIDGNRLLSVNLGKEFKGHISLGKISCKIHGKESVMDTSSLADGEYPLILVLEEGTVLLGYIIKINGVIAPEEKRESKIQRLSIDERWLEERIGEIDSRLKKIEEKVYGSSIF